MRVVDTSAWVEWLNGSETGSRIANLLPRREDWIVPTIVQFELAKVLTREVGEQEAEQVIAFTETCRVVSLDSNLALAAAHISTTHRLATADAIIYATARASGADILTCDAHFEGLQHVVFVAKHGR